MRSQVFGIAVLGIVICIAPLAASAQVNAGLDQYQILGDISWAIHSNLSMGQWFTVGSDGLLSAVELCLHGGIGFDDLVVEIYEFNGGVLGTMLASTTISSSELGPWQFALVTDLVTATLVPLEHLGIVVSNGQTIAILMSTTTALPDLYGVRGVAIFDSYAGGDRIVGITTDPGNDLTFKIFVAQQVFADDFELSNTNAWSAAVP